MSGLRPTIPVETAAKLLDIGRGSAYKAAASGEIPAVRVGRRLLVLTVPFLEMLGVPPDAADLPSEVRESGPRQAPDSTATSHAHRSE